MNPTTPMGTATPPPQVLALRLVKQILHLDLVLSAPRKDLLLVADLDWVVNGRTYNAFPEGLPPFLKSRRFKKVHSSLTWLA